MIYQIENIKTLKFNIKQNEFSGNQFNLCPNLSKEVIEKSTEKFDLKLSFNLHSTEKEKLPIEIELDIIGSFVLKDYTEEEKQYFLNINSVQILFPYMRSILSTAMSSLMIPPIFLPLVDASQLFNKK